jgi:hypothetical protein
MIAARAVAVLCLLAAPLLAAPRANAGPALAAVALPDGGDVRTAILVGPSGEVYEPAGPATWTRRSGGGIAADVIAAATANGELFAIGRSTPLYRRRAGVWQAVRLGQRGGIVWGTGPLPALAVGRHVFVLSRTGWTRAGQAPPAVTAVWATAERDIVVAAGGALWRLRGGGFARVPKPAAATGVFGDAPWALTDGAAIDLTRPRAVAPLSTGPIAAAAAAGDAVWFLIALPDGSFVLERHPAPPVLARRPTVRPAPRPPIQLTAVPVPAGALITGLVVDRLGRALILTRDGAVQVWADGAWTAGTVGDALPPPRTGAGPARTR